ncbi:MAG: TetR/AcrR family transcriptional regulator [Clostridiales bacterium]|nr:TetR/AcrR family transcriptional regulator [Clostridiales bacterium]
MPPKQSITKESILESAYEIVLEQGLQQITARNVAEKLKCSTQPIYWYFTNKQDFLHSVYLYINKRYIYEMLDILEKPDFFVEMTKWLISISKQSRYLFSVLFFYNGYDDENLFDVMRNLIDDKVMISKLKTRYQLGDEGAKYLYIRCCVLWASINHQIRSNFFENEEQFIDFMSSMFSEAIESAKLKS